MTDRIQGVIESLNHTIQVLKIDLMYYNRTCRIVRIKGIFIISDSIERLKEAVKELERMKGGDDGD